MDDKTIFQKSIGENLKKYRKLKGILRVSWLRKPV